MKFSELLPNLVLAIGLACFLTVAVLDVTGARTFAGRWQQEQKRIAELPNVISKVKSIEVLGVRIEGQPDTAEVIIEVRNNSDKPIIAISVESGNDKDASGVNVNGFEDGNAPSRIVLEARGTTTLNMPLNYVHAGEPVRIGGVIYDDGTEEGEEVTLGTMRRQKEHYKAKGKKKKGGSSQP